MNDGDEGRCNMQPPVMIMMELDWCNCNRDAVIQSQSICETGSTLRQLSPSQRATALEPRRQFYRWRWLPSTQPSEVSSLMSLEGTILIYIIPEFFPVRRLCHVCL